MVMSAFRRSVVADTKQKGGGRRGSFYDRYRLPAEPAPEAAGILLRGEYIDPSPAPELVEVDPATGRAKPVVNPYFKYKQHKHMGKKNGKDWFSSEICSAGNDPHNPQPCVGCFSMDSGNKAVTVSDQFALGYLHLAYYHGHPLLDDNGQIQMKKDNSGPVVVYDECSGRTCNYCRVMQGQPPIAHQQDPWPGYPPNTLSTVFGRRRYLELGKGHLSDISGIDTTIGSMCGNCASQLTTDGFACPTCNSVVIDMANDPRTDEQIALEVIKPYPCMRCQRAVMLREVVSCEVCERQGRQGVQLSVFDVVLMAKRQGEGTKSHVVRTNHMTIEAFAQRIDPQFLNGKTLREYVTEMAGQPYDFFEMFKPKSLADQSKRLELPMPPGRGGQPQQQYAAYGQQPQQPQQSFYGTPQQPAAIPQGGQMPYPQQPGMVPAPAPGYPAPAPGGPVAYPPQMQPQQPGPQPMYPVPPPFYGK